jgi:hypothetical protein
LNFFSFLYFSKDIRKSKRAKLYYVVCCSCNDQMKYIILHFHYL